MSASSAAAPAAAPSSSPSSSSTSSTSSSSSSAPANFSSIFPLELLDKCVGSPLLLLMKNEKEIEGTLRGYDDFVNIVLEDVTETEMTREGKKVAKMDCILLNGNNITMMIPGGAPAQ